MTFRLADSGDLPRLKAMYAAITAHMNAHNIYIWDDIYPCAFLGEDINRQCLYILEDDGEIVSAFALCDSHAGAASIAWENQEGNALYLDRLGVNVGHLRKGIGSTMLRYAMTAAKDRGASLLRLFVVDRNRPAIDLYVKNGFQKAAGVYADKIDDTLILYEYGFEKEISL